MKKLFTLFSALALVFTSCSTESSSNDPILVTEVTETIEYNGNSQTFTVNFNYNGNKLVSQIYGSDNINFTYTGDLITKTEYYHNNEVVQENFYEYNTNDQLIIFKRLEYETGGIYESIYTYTYNTNGTVSYLRESGYSPNLNDSSNGTFYFNTDGLVSQVDTSYGEIIVYTYDNKNSPYKNILGVDKLLFEENDANSYIKNIITSVTEYGSNSYSSNYVYTYNSNNYPTQSIEDDGYEVVTRTYTYNHN